LPRVSFRVRSPSRREAVATFVFVGLACLTSVLSGPRFVNGWSIDVLTTVGGWVERPPEQVAETVVIALDEETSDRAPFLGSALNLWTPKIARVLDAVIAGGATVVGFDVVFASSIEESQIPFGGASVGEVLRGFDRPYLQSIASAAGAGKLVLGEVQIGRRRLRPFAGQRFAVGSSENIRLLNVAADRDGVVRRVPSVFGAAGRRFTSFSGELALRANPSLKGGTAEDAVTLNFVGVPAIPTYSLGDLDACLERGEKDFFARHFAGKVVVFGADFASGDQLSTSRRFLPGKTIMVSSRCARAQTSTSETDKRTIDGVYVQAVSVENRLRSNALTRLSETVGGAVTLAGAALGAFAALMMPPGGAVTSVLGLAVTWLALAAAAFAHALALPLFGPIIAAALALGATIAFRLGIVDREKRRLIRAFGLYLAPSLVERLDSGAMPALGGEAREVSIFFSDIAGFSTLSENLTPQAVVTLMNEYFSFMTDAIEDAGGYVDKYVGDAVVALFGAPASDEHHAAQAVAAALTCRDRLKAFNSTRATPLRHRVGLNSGQALVGNVGSKRRLNFTAFGDSVNLAARIEELCAIYGADLLVSEEVKARSAEAFVWREIDTVRVRGRVRPVTLFEPLAKSGDASVEQMAYARAYAKGLAAWRRREFRRAAESFAVYSASDAAAACFLERCLALATTPPGTDWEPIFQQGAK
jgi:adenylate cyclase